MRNIIKIFREMFRSELSENKIEVDLPIIYNIAKRCGFTLAETEKANKKYLKVVQKNTQVAFLSSTNDNIKIAKFACLSDIHAGAKGIDFIKLRSFLIKCKKVDIKYLFIAGDLFEGYNMYPNHEMDIEESTPDGQAKILYNELINFDFYLIFINGNHDYSFEVNHMENPNKILYEMLKEKNKKVIFIDSFYGDIVIQSIGIRLAHLDNTFAQSREYPCIKYAKDILEERDYTKNPKTGEKYKIHVVICGHIHKHEIYQYKETLIFQPGSIKEEDINHERRIGFIVKITVEGEILKEYVVS